MKQFEEVVLLHTDTRWCLCTGGTEHKSSVLHFVKDNFTELGVIWTIAGDWGKPPTWSHSPRLSQSVMKGRNRGNSG